MFNKRQYNLLSERYFECLLGDFSSLLWMVGQAPLVAMIIIIRFKSWQATETLLFVLSLSAVWFGCINACREISKEKALFRREKLLGLEVGPYLASKVKILSIIGLLETFIFYYLLEKYLDLGVVSVLGFVTLFLLYFGGMTLGLMISRVMTHSSRAVITVPLAIIPQIVFSKFILPENSLTGLAAKVEKLMLVKWGFEALEHAKSGDILWGSYFSHLGPLLLLSFLFILVTLFHLCLSEDEYV